MKMEKAFELFIADEGENHTEAWAKLLLPASPYELLDAIEKSQVKPERPVYLEIQKYALEMEGLKPYIGVERTLPSLYAFNKLAEKLVTLDDTQRLVLVERLKDEENGGHVPLPRVYDLAAGDGAFTRLNLMLPEPDYIALLENCLAELPPDLVVHRLTGDGAKRELLAPLWTGDKKRVLNAIQAAFDRDQVVQGSRWRNDKPTSHPGGIGMDQNTTGGNDHDEN